MNILKPILEAEAERDEDLQLEAMNHIEDNNQSLDHARAIKYQQDQQEEDEILVKASGVHLPV